MALLNVCINAFAGLLKVLLLYVHFVAWWKIKSMVRMWLEFGKNVGNRARRMVGNCYIVMLCYCTEIYEKEMRIACTVDIALLSLLIQGVLITHDEYCFISINEWVLKLSYFLLFI